MHMRLIPRAALIAAVMLGLALAGCGKKQPAAPAPSPAAQVPAPTAQDLVNVPLAVKAVTLGNAIGDTKQVTTPLASFGPKDSIYAVVETIGSGKASLKAAWTFHKGDKSAPVNETTQEIDAAGPSNSEFHISKPDGWPVGDYQVEVFLNGVSAGVHKFSVR
jgi:predicted small lipoprotein YifL